jgi:p-cumate 2,3-dioxygenase alpha subunit
METLTVGDRSESYVREDAARSQFLVSRAVFTDEAILEQERRSIFGKCWLYAAFESELPEPNSFITRSVGGRELLIARDRKGTARAFFNTCPHRGATVERKRSGRQLAFQCFYHGWAFNNNGDFATRYRPGDYPEDFNESGCKNLMQVPRFEEYRGMFFVNFDRGAVSLEEYLGGARKYIDLVLDHSASGMEINSGAQEYSIRANWKLLVENSIDSYHAVSTHKTYFDYLRAELGVDPTANPASRSLGVPNSFSEVGGLDLGGGHAVATGGAAGPVSWGRPVAHWIPAWGEAGKKELEARKRDLVERHGPDRAEVIASWNRNMVVFPNLVINDIMAVTFRTFYPVKTDLMHVQAWSLAPKDETPEFRVRRLQNFIEFLGPGGFATPDDQEALEACQRGYRNVETGWNDLSRGMMRGDKALVGDERQMRAFWREWDRRMGAPGVASAAAGSRASSPT